MRSAKDMSDEDWASLTWEIGDTFTPAAPLNEADLFAGRLDQLKKLLDATSERGKHAILYGERGVGKTSLSGLLHKLFPPIPRHIFSIRVQADPSDNFDSIWRKAFKDIWVTIEREDGSGEIQRSLDQLYPSAILPDDVRRELQVVFKPSQVPIIIIDEFDKIEDELALSLMANTIKALSDYSVNVTVIIVGVAADVNELIKEHESIQRCIEQVPMPRMSVPERIEIIERALKKLAMTIEPDGLSKAAYLSRGLPSYVHALGQYAALSAVARRSLNITAKDVEAAISRVLQKSQETVQESYAKAVHSNRNDSMYREVLLACALAETDDRGTFTPTSVCGPLTTILGRNKEVQISAFQQHLQKFITDERGRILGRRGMERSYKYRFEDPMMQPYVIMKGIEQGLISPSFLEAVAYPAQPRLPSI